MLDTDIALACWSRRLGICAAAAPIQKSHRSPYSASLCVAPSAIFADYDRVIASLKSEQEADMAGRWFSVPQQLQEGDDRTIEHDVTGRDGVKPDPDSSIAKGLGTFNGDGEYRVYEGPRPSLHHVPAALDISNTYDRRRLSVIRKTRRLQPYECRRDDTSTSSSARCPYISPEDGTQCRKINKTPQEGGRHWRSCHLYKEAKEMLTGILPVGQGTAITSKAHLDEIAPHIQCALCNALITRSDAMRRHLRTNCKSMEDTPHIQNDSLRKKARKLLT